MKKRWKLFATMFGGALFATMVCLCFCQMIAKAGEDREVTQSSIMNYVVGIENYSDDQIAAADFNDDGTLNMLDAVISERIDVYGEDYLDGETTDTEEQADKEQTDTENTTDDSQAEEQTEDTTDDSQAEEQTDNTTDETSDSEEQADNEDKSVENGNIVYLNATNTNWTEAYIYSWQTGTLLTPMTEVEGFKGVYSAVLPEGVTEFLFINNNQEQWDNNKQTVNVTFSTSGMIYVLESASDGKYSGSWKEIVYE